MEKINDKFITVPKDIIIGDDTILKRYGDKGFLIMLYISKHRTNFDTSYISVANCIEECGYKLPKKENATVKEFKDIIKAMIKDKIITTDKDDFKLNDLIVCYLDDESNNFFKLEQYQYDWIMEYKGKEKKINLLKLFCVLKARIYKRQKDEDINDGLYEVGFPSYKDIKNNCLISESNIKKYIDILVNLNLIRYRNAGLMHNLSTGEVKECNNTYAIYKSGWEDELEGSIRLFKQKKKEEGWIITKKKK